MSHDLYQFSGLIWAMLQKLGSECTSQVTRLDVGLADAALPDVLVKVRLTVFSVTLPSSLLRKGGGERTLFEQELVRRVPCGSA